MSDLPRIEEATLTIAWRKLRQRKVVQWGLAYIAVAWGFLQGLEYVGEAFGWPAALRPIAILLLLVGWLLALVLAWYHGDRGEQRVRRAELALIGTIIAAGVMLLWRYEATRATAQAPEAATASRPTADEVRPSIAVLPFDNHSRQADDLVFVDGIHDDLLTRLAQLSAIKVISRTSVERFRDTKLPLREVAAQLGVTTIVEGGVQRAGSRVRINVQLIDANSDAHLWAETYDRELTAANVFAIQAELAGTIAGTLSLQLTPAEQARVATAPTGNLEAWEAYQRGRQQMARRTTDGLAAAVKDFERAIALDGRFAAAYAGLADALFLQTDYASAPYVATMGRATEMLGMALRIDPELPEALTTSAKFTELKGDLATAESLYRRAIALDRNYALAHHWYLILLVRSGRQAEALSEARILVELDPLSPSARQRLGEMLVSLGRFDEGIAALDALRRFEPGLPGPYAAIGRKLALVDGRLDLAVPWLQKAADLDLKSAYLAASVAQAMLDLDDTEGAREWLDIAHRRGGPNFWTDEVAALRFLYTGGWAQSAQAARRALTISGEAIFVNWPLALLRDADLRDRRFADAIERYEQVLPQLQSPDGPRIDIANLESAVDLACALQRAERNEDALRLLDAADAHIGMLIDKHAVGAEMTSVRTLALRGKPQQAIEALRTAVESGWRGPYWRYARDFDPALDSIRRMPEFAAVFADIERDITAQRARLASRLPDAPLTLASND